MKINIVDPINNYANVFPLDIRSKGVTKAELKVGVNEPFQLNLTVNTNLGAKWQTLRDNFDYGIRIKSGRFDSVFVKFRDPQEDNNFGVENLGFAGASFLLKTSEKLLEDTEYNGSLISFLSSLDPQFNWVLFGPDIDVHITTGQLSNYDILQQAIKAAAGYVWFDGPVLNNGVSLIPTIYVGDSNYAKSTLQGISNFATVTARKKTFLDNPFNKDDVIINSIKKSYTGNVVTYLKVLGDQGQGTAKNSAIRLEDPNADYIQPDFPLVQRQNGLTLQNSYYIYNINAVKVTKSNKFETQPFTLSGNVVDSNGDQSTFILDAQRFIYNSGVAYLKSQTSNNLYTYDLAYKQVYYPGTTFNVKYKETIKMLDGRTLTVFDINNNFLLKEETYDLLKLP
jgi:hypothetical protein